MRLTDAEMLQLRGQTPQHETALTFSSLRQRITSLAKYSLPVVVRSEPELQSIFSSVASQWTSRFAARVRGQTQARLQRAAQSGKVVALDESDESVQVHFDTGEKVW